jgi:AraC-like DNA-binding protein/quercetin dioxygenase-like cupin family protein
MQSGKNEWNRRIYTSREEKENIPVGLVPFCIEREMLHEDYPLHEHDFSQLFVVTKGHAAHLVNHNSYQIDAGSVFVVTDAIPHGFTEVKGLELYNILYDSQNLFDQAEKLKQHPGFQALFYLHPYYQLQFNYENRFVLDYEGIRYAVQLLETLIEEVETAEPGFETVIQSYFMVLVTFLSREYVKGLHLSDRSMAEIAKAVTFLEKHFTAEITVAGLADIAGLSERQFTRIFKATYGTTPKRYLVQQRITYACRLMQYSGKRGPKTVTEVAYDSGFTDGNYFSRVFKEIVGMSPSEYLHIVEK